MIALSEGDEEAAPLPWLRIDIREYRRKYQAEVWLAPAGSGHPCPRLELGLHPSAAAARAVVVATLRALHAAAAGPLPWKPYLTPRGESGMGAWVHKPAGVRFRCEPWQGG